MEHRGYFIEKAEDGLFYIMISDLIIDSAHSEEDAKQKIDQLFVYIDSQ